MLIDESEGSFFLEQYKELLAHHYGAEPSSGEEWAEARDQMMLRVKTGAEDISGKEMTEVEQAVREAVTGRFCFLKRYKDHYAFCHLESGRFFAVRALTTPIEEIVEEFSVVTTCLIPFREKMICDGLVVSANIYFGKNYTKEMRDSYWNAKREGTLIWNLSKARTMPPKKTPSTGRTQTLSKPTATQGQYLAFIYYYTKVNGQAPAEKNFQQFFQVSPPTVHQMIQRLALLKFISKTPGQARSIRLLLPREALPDLN